MDWAETTARWNENHLSFGIWCNYVRVYGICTSHWSQNKMSDMFIHSNLIQWPLLLADIAKPASRVRAWICNYIHKTQWDVIIHPFPNFDGSSVINVPINLGHGWVITSNINHVWSLNHALISISGAPAITDVILIIKITEIPSKLL